MGALERPRLIDLTSDPGYSGRVMMAIQALAQARDQVDLIDTLGEVVRLMGVEQAAFVSYIRGDVSHEKFRFALVCEPAWCFEYQRDACYSIDPWIAYCSTHSEPICASSLRGLTKDQQRVVDLAIRHGMCSTCVVPAPSAGQLSRVGMLAIGSSTPGFFEAPGFAAFAVLARSLSMEVNAWLLKQLRTEFVDQHALTDEDLLLLAYERAGLGTKHVAREADLSTSAIDSRWKRINQRLGTPNRKASAAIAAEYGLI